MLHNRRNREYSADDDELLYIEDERQLSLASTPIIATYASFHDWLFLDYFAFPMAYRKLFMPCFVSRRHARLMASVEPTFELAMRDYSFSFRRIYD